MMTMDLPATSRLMIDARLDSIERALMAKGTGRGDRHQILAAIEDQILEMLSRVESDEPTRDDVLSTLAKLDPPEAYLELNDGELGSFPTMQPPRRRVENETQFSHDSSAKLNVLAVISFVLTCLALVGSVSWWLLAFFGLIPLAIVTIAAGICGTVALYQFTLNNQRSRGKWMAATACACAPAVPFLSWLTLIVVEGI